MTNLGPLLVAVGALAGRLGEDLLDQCVRESLSFRPEDVLGCPHHAGPDPSSSPWDSCGLAELLHLLEADADDGGLGEGEGYG